MERQARFLAGSVVCFMIGFMLVFYSTKLGIGTSPDSASYLSLAENLRSGKGMSNYLGRAGSHFPPGYSAAIVLTAFVTGRDARYDAPRLLGAACFGLLAAAVFLSVANLCNDAEPGALAAFAVLSSPGLLGVSSMAWSEALFINLTLAGLALLWQLLDTGSRHFLVAGSALIGLSALVRYAGLFWVPAGVFVLLLLPRSFERWRRVTNALLFAVISLAPYVVWSIFAREEFGDSSGRRVAFHPPTTEKLSQGVSVIASWLVPNGSVWWAFVWVIVLILAVWLALRTEPKTGPKDCLALSGHMYFTSTKASNVLFLLIAFTTTYLI